MSDFLRPGPAPRRRLREALDRGMVIAPGVYDGVTARLVEQAGFDAAYLTGFGATASLLGRSDIGLLTETEMADAVRRICAAVDVPLIADADTGYGGVLNVVRTVQDYERAGASAIQLEDQVFPKRCGHMSGKEVIARDEAVAKIRAAVAARTDPDLLVIARTDAAAVDGLDDAIDRAKAYSDAGADILFVEAPPTVGDIARIARELAGHRLLFNWVEGGRTEEVSIELIRELGFALVIFPISALLAATRAVRDLLASLQSTGSTAAYADRMDGFDDVVSLMGLEQTRSIEESFRRG